MLAILTDARDGKSDVAVNPTQVIGVDELATCESRGSDGQAPSKTVPCTCIETIEKRVYWVTQSVREVTDELALALAEQNALKGR
jgi:hypothetical protein